VWRGEGVGEKERGDGAGWGVVNGEAKKRVTLARYKIGRRPTTKRKGKMITDQIG